MQPYRSATDEVRAHAQRLVAGHTPPDESDLRRLYRRRMARIGFGVAGSLGGVLTALTIVFANHGQLDMLKLSWAMAGAGGLLCYVVAHWHYRLLQARKPEVTDDPYDLVIQFSRTANIATANPRALERVDALGLASLRWPLMAGAMLLPLTLLTLFFAMGGTRARELDELCRFAGVLTVHVHCYAMIAAWQFPHKRKSLRMVVIASLLGFIPFGLSVIAVFPIAVVIVCCYIVPLAHCIDSEGLRLEVARLAI